MDEFDYQILKSLETLLHSIAHKVQGSNMHEEATKIHKARQLLTEARHDIFRELWTGGIELED